MLPTTPAATFYFLVAVANAMCYLLLSAADHFKDFHQRGARYSIATCPTFVPRSFFLLLHKKHVYPVLCHSVSPLFFLASQYPNHFSFRCTAALLISLYSLAETSVTSSHRDYLTLYTSWALCLTNSDALASGFALGFCIVLIAGSGWTKVLIGGWSAWSHASTLANIFKAYHSCTLANCGPLLPSLNRTIRTYPILITALSTMTLLFECVVVPLSLFMPSNQRWAMMFVSVAMHIGIGVLQSFIIGAAFLPNVATYWFGFGSIVVEVGSTAWLASVVVVGLWGALTFALTTTANKKTVRLLPEDWPCTPFALFAWNGNQWKTLFDRYVTSNRRLVVYNSKDIIKEGLSIAPRCWSREACLQAKQNRDVVGNNKDPIMHNGWELLCGETFCHTQVFDELHLNDDGEWNAKEFVSAVSKWMENCKRFVVVGNGGTRSVVHASGKTIDRVAYVIIAPQEKEGEGETIVKVVAQM